MQIGYNNDVEYRDKTFHIQTEDHGERAASIESQIFHAGAILDTSIISYSKVLAETDDVDERIARVRQLMQANHKKLYLSLFKGKYDEMVGLEPIGGVEVSEVDFVPSQEAVPAAALEIERGNLDAIAALEGPGGDAVDLATLQAQLNADAAAFEAGEDDDDAAPTTMLSADDIGLTQQSPSVPAAAVLSRRTGSSPGTKTEFPSTGVAAWRGVAAKREDDDFVAMVEKQLSA